MLAFSETFHGVAHTWLCDSMGHMNTRHHAAMFDDALFHCLYQLDRQNRPSQEKKYGWADVHLEFDFKAEVKEGTAITISSAVERVGTTSVTIFHCMTDSQSGKLLATMRSVSVYFDLESRKPVVVPERIRNQASGKKAN